MSLRTEKVAESVARQILQDIQRNKLEPGSTLPPETAMIERFGIGRGSLREALRILEINGLVTLKPGPGGGPVVAAQNPASFGQVMTLHLQSLGATYRELLEARVEYEALLARRAAEREGDEPGRIVRTALDTGPEGLDNSSYAASTGGFHQAVGSAGGNPVIALVSEAIYAIWTVRVTSVLYPPDQREDVIRQHESITRAIERHDAKRAEKLMREHMELYRQYCEERYPARMDDLVDWT
jgi:GntR family transcriptional regulator, transcriptional repressor for pyruvate dehydrogenase complex